jgi:hypothetical protein
VLLLLLKLLNDDFELELKYELWSSTEDNKLLNDELDCQLHDEQDYDELLVDDEVHDDSDDSLENNRLLQ